MEVTGGTELVERDVLIETLNTTLDSASAGDGSTIVLDAPAGLGKSALLTHAAETAQHAGTTVLRARGDELGRHVPHGVLQQLFGRHARTLDREPIALPLLGALGMHELDAPITPGQVATGAWWLLDTIAERSTHGVLVIVDDIHHIDGASLDALAFVASRVDGMRCTMLVAHRTGEPIDNEAAYGRLRHATAATVTSLELLSRSGAAHVVRSIEPGADDELIDTAYTASGGNPFLLTEFVRHAREDTLPPRVLDHVRLRVADNQALRQVGAATATLGQWATISRIATVARISVDHAEAMVDELMDACILERGDEDCTFCHPLLREAMLASVIDDAGRRRLALRAANALDDDGAPPAAIASLLLDAPLGNEPTTSLRLVSGARAALAAGAPLEAVRFIERAIGEPIDDARERATAHQLAAQAHRSMRNWPAAIHSLSAVLDLTSDAYARSDLRAVIANLHIEASDIVNAMREFEAAALEIEHVPGAATRFVELRASGQAFGRFLGMASDTVDPLLDVLPTDPADDTHAHRILLSNVAMAHIFANDDAPRIRELAHRALAGSTLLEESGVDAPLLFTAMATLTWVDDHSVLSHLDAAVAHARERGSVLGHATALAARGGTRWRRGDLAHAVADLDGALDARRDGWTGYLPFVGYCAARAFLDLGDRDAVRRIVREVIPDGDLTMWGPIEPFAHAARGVAEIANHEPARALEHMLDAVAAADRQRSTAVAISDWRFEATELAASLDRADDVRDLAIETLARARQLGAARPLGMALRALAAITTDDDERRSLLDEAVRVLEDGEIRVELARTLLQRGRDLHSRDDLERALEIATSCGARLIVEELAHAGVASNSPDDHELLTPSELRVAELAASGMTNREIAQALFVTVKAVEFHLSNAYRKLEISGRRDLAIALIR